MNRKLWWIVISFVVLLVLGATATFMPKQLNQKGSANIVFPISGTNGLDVKLNNQKLDVKDLNDIYELKAGSYTLTARKSGYKDFATTFTVQKDETVIINAAMERETENTASLQQAKPKIGDTLQGWKIEDAQYFGNTSWGLLTVLSPESIGGFMLVKYDDAKQSWEVAEQPTSSFSVSNLQELGAPAELIDYVQEMNLTN